MEPNESVEQHLSREVWEEVGIAVHGVAMYCDPQSDSVSISNQVLDDDIACYKWVDFADLKNYDFIPNMIPVIHAFLRKYA